MTLTVEEWVGLDRSGKQEDTGTDMVSLLGFLSHVNIAYGYRIRSILKGVAYYSFTGDNQAPMRFWYNHPVPGYDTKEFAFDPLDMMVSGVRSEVTEEAVMGLMGIPPVPEDVLEQAKWVHTLVAAQGLLK